MNQNILLLGYPDAQIANLFREMLSQVESGKLKVSREGQTDAESLSTESLMESLEDSKRMRDYRSRTPAMVMAAPMLLRHQTGITGHLRNGEHCMPIAIANLRVTPIVKAPPDLSALLAKHACFLFDETVTMKVPAQCSGWMARMFTMGYKVSSRSERFGRQVHLIKKDGVQVSLTQGNSAVVSNKVGQFNLYERRILTDLRAAGALMDSPTTKRRAA